MGPFSEPDICICVCGMYLGEWGYLYIYPAYQFLAKDEERTSIWHYYRSGFRPTAALSLSNSADGHWTIGLQGMVHNGVASFARKEWTLKYLNTTMTTHLKHIPIYTCQERGRDDPYFTLTTHIQSSLNLRWEQIYLIQYRKLCVQARANNDDEWLQ